MIMKFQTAVMLLPSTCKGIVQRMKNELEISGLIMTGQNKIINKRSCFSEIFDVFQDF